MDKYLVLDIGASAIKFALMSSDEILEQGMKKTPKESFSEFIDAIEEIYKLFENKVKGLAICVPGLIDSDTGYAVHGGGVLCIQQVNLKEEIEKRISINVEIENDAKCAALGEVMKGELQGIKDGVVLVLGSGIGGGIISNGELVRGAHLGAGEFSFIRTDKYQPQEIDEIWGRTGSTVDFVRHVAEEFGYNPDSYTGKDLFSDIRAGNQAITKRFEEFCNGVAVQIINLQAILDPEVFVIGGGMSADELFTKSIRQSLKILNEDMITRSIGAQAKVVRSQLGNSANLYGALYNYLNK